MALFAKWKTGTDIEKKHKDTKWRGRWDKLGDWDWHKYTIDTIYKKQATSEKLLYSSGNPTQCTKCSVVA